MPTSNPLLRSAADQARLEAGIVDMIEQRTPYQKALGMTVQALQPQLVLRFMQPQRVLRFNWRPDLVGHPQSGRLHGGVIAAVLDSVAGCALMMGLAAKHPHDTLEQMLHRVSRLGTIDMRVDYLHPGIGQHFLASADITRLGGRVGSTQMRLHNDEGQLIATAAASYIVS